MEPENKDKTLVESSKNNMLFEKDPRSFKRTEEVEAIIERMPTRFGSSVTLFVLILVFVFAVFGWIIKYPDVVTGIISISDTRAAVKLVAQTSGKLQLNDMQNFKVVKEGQYIGIIHNAADLKDVKKLKSLISSFSIQDARNHLKMDMFPKNLSLGELSLKYFAFLNAYSQTVQYFETKLYDKQIDALSKLVLEYESVKEIAANRIHMSGASMGLVGKFSGRDSILFSKKVLSEAERDQSKMTLLAAQDGYQNTLKEHSYANSQLQQAKSQLQQTMIQKAEKENKLELDLIAAFTDLDDNFKMWEEKYVLMAPSAGKVQFLKFWTENEFVQSGEPVFAIVPEHHGMLGQMTMPVNGAGKVRVGQEVIIKLDNYPYMEYGSIKGLVSSISLSTNTQNTAEGIVENYLVNVSLPEKLKTNYGAQLSFNSVASGTGDVIVHQRRLIERLFDNLRYKLN
jgi:hypothetical protein